MHAVRPALIAATAHLLECVRVTGRFEDAASQADFEALLARVEAAGEHDVAQRARVALRRRAGIDAVLALGCLAPARRVHRRCDCACAACSSARVEALLARTAPALAA